MILRAYFSCLILCSSHDNLLQSSESNSSLGCKSHLLSLMMLCVLDIFTSGLKENEKLQFTPLVYDIKVKQLAQPPLSVCICVMRVCVCAPVLLYSSPALGHNSFYPCPFLASDVAQ